ncbi:MAG: hypothetical protein U5N85_00625 [Arcicella sp.]|nr:hypothetical protein [Arcicella sp.]
MKNTNNRLQVNKQVISKLFFNIIDIIMTNIANDPDGDIKTHGPGGGHTRPV